MLDESKVDKYLARIVRKAGGVSLKFVSPGKAGVPDRIVVLPGGLVWFVELKAPRKKPRALQRAVMRKMRGLGCHVSTIDNTKTARAFVELQERRLRHAIHSASIPAESD